MIFDIHAHLYDPRWYPAKFNDYLVRDFAGRNMARTGRRVSGSQLASVIRFMADRTGEATLRIMDEAGINRRVILIVDWGLELGEAEISLEAIHEEVLAICRKSKGRLVGFAGVDPRRKSGPDLLRRAFDDLGARGLKLHPTGDWSLDDDRTEELVNIAATRGLPVLVHVGSTIRILSDKHSQPNALIRLARRLPAATFIAGHSGFELFRWFLSETDVPTNIYFDISGWQEMAKSGNQCFAENLSALLCAFPGRVCFGSDSPFFSYNLAAKEKEWVDRLSAFVNESPEDLGRSAEAMLSCPADLQKQLDGSN
jgi:uncharacterized protein